MNLEEIRNRAAVYDSLHKEIATLKAQRDELLAMLKEEHWGRARCRFDDYGLNGRCSICAAITNAEKDKP